MVSVSKKNLVDPRLLIGNLVQVLPDQLYFACLNEDIGEHVAGQVLYISLHGKFHYEPFYEDFGPWNLSVLYRLCILVDNIVNSEHRRGRKVVMYCADNGRIDIEKVRVNAAYVMAAYLIIYHNYTADNAYLVIEAAQPPKFIGFRDAAMSHPSYFLHVHDVLRGVEKALQLGWLDFTDFDYLEYERYEKVENGDFNWIIPGKILSFCGPHRESRVEDGYPYHAPHVYFDYFNSHGISTIVRLNVKVYEAKDFTDAGFDHVDLFFVDGSTPSDEIVQKFIDVVDNAEGGVAVHCKAGLGRTGTLIACWMMKEYALTAAECMAWLRICRPGSVIGPQQGFLIEKQRFCWSLSKNNGVHMARKGRSGEKKNVTKLVNKVDGIKLAPRRDTSPSCSRTLPASFCDVRSRENCRPRPNILPVRRKDRRPGAVVPEGNSNDVDDETKLDEKGRSQGDRLLAIKARSQHEHQIDAPQLTTFGRSHRSTAPPLVLPSQAFLNKNREPITPPRSRTRSNNINNNHTNNINQGQNSPTYRSTRGVGNAATAAANAKTGNEVLQFSNSLLYKPSSAVFPSIASRRSDATRFSSPTTPIKPMTPTTTSAARLNPFRNHDVTSSPISRCTVSAARSDFMRSIFSMEASMTAKTNAQRKIQLARPRPYPPQGVRVELAANGNAYDLRPRVIREQGSPPGSQLPPNTDALLGNRRKKRST
ncbi:unnamed protein product [Caenorhabditis auriculariae]|uniref:protein-tyrosine-phosphatase n=1 Tax=Caenorhabditis auriculariae TaxID=2777116 RepID=A0A8S1HMW7_9PELO|nr:unnamed protein product [Caenorhabditis auriculariae]